MTSTVMDNFPATPASVSAIVSMATTVGVGTGVPDEQDSGRGVDQDASIRKVHLSLK